jgi:hypothetical protein
MRTEWLVVYVTVSLCVYFVHFVQTGRDVFNKQLRFSLDISLFV